VYIAGHRRDIEKLKGEISARDEMEKAHGYAVLACLYVHLEDMANLLKSLQLSKRSKVSKSLALDQARSSTLGQSLLPPRPATSCPASPALPQENSQLLLEFQQTDSEHIIAIQRSMGDINAMLSSFGMKVAEHQEMSDRSKG